MSAAHPATTDLCDAHGPVARVLSPHLRSFGARRRYSGLAVTIKCFEDNSRLKALSATPGVGRVIVIDGGGSLRCALLGDQIAEGLRTNGWAGVVIHGCVRDTAALAALDLGVHALAACPRRSNKNGEGQVDVVIEVGGVIVRPGDRIVADEDGVIVLDP